MAGQGLTWSQFSKRYDQCLRSCYERMKNDKPFILLDKDRESEDGVHIYFTKIAFNIPAKQRGGSWKKVDNTYIDFEPKRYASYRNFKDAIKRIGLDDKSDLLDAPVKVNFYTSRAKTLATSVNSGRVLKDVEFGGRPPRGTVRSIYWGKLGFMVNELGISYTLNYPTATEEGEADFISSFNKQLEEVAGANGGRGLDMDIGGTVFENIIGVNKVSGTGKADLAFVSLKDRKLIEVCWASHKKGSKASDFGQWGGVTKLYNTNTTVREFVDYMHQVVGRDKIWDFTKMGATTLGMKLDGASYANLRKYAIYGPNYGQSTFGPEKCNVVLQGNPIVKYGVSHSTLDMSGHLVKFGEEMTGDYEPVLMCIKKASTENILKGVGRADTGGKPGGGIQGARFSIFPGGGRTVTHWVMKNQQGQYTVTEA